MKISTKNSIFVQKKDLEFLKYQLRSLPASISEKIFENSELDPDDYDKYDFFEFTDDEDIEYFKSLEWLVDYYDITALDNNESRQFREALAKKYDDVARRLYSITDKGESYKSTLQEYTILSYQITTLEDINDINNGMLKIKMPNIKVSIPKLIKSFLAKVSK